VGYRLIERSDHLHGKNEGQILGAPVVLRRFGCPRNQPLDMLVSSKLHTRCFVALGHARQKLVRDIAVHEKSLHGVADPAPLDFGVERDLLGHLQIGARINIRVAVADSCLDDRHFRVLNDGLDEARSASGDEAVNQPRRLHHRRRRRAVGGWHKLYAVRGQPGTLGSGGDYLSENDVRMDGLLAAAQYDRVSGFEAEPRSIDGDVRARLEDDADDAQGHRHLFDVEPVRKAPAPVHAADRVGQRRKLVQPFGHVGDALAGEREAVNESIGEPGGPSGFQVHSVLLENPPLGHNQRIRHRNQRGVLVPGVAGRQPRRGFAGIPRHRVYGFDHIYRHCYTPATRLSRWITSSNSLYPRMSLISDVFRPMIFRTSPDP